MVGAARGAAFRSGWGRTDRGDPGAGPRDGGRPLVLQAYGLTERETRVAQLVLLGLSTDEIVDRLLITTLTVQQHLKAVFDKIGVHSRRELVARVFAQHYLPRMAGAAGEANDRGAVGT